MASNERMYALYKAMEYISLQGVEGDIVECGVWRGGSAMICAYTLNYLRDIKRTLYLYDTYKGMPRPTKEDRSIRGDKSALHVWRKNAMEDGNSWCYADLNDVKRNMQMTKYPMKRIRFVEGMVEKTIPTVAPRKIALLRLDTDWYASTLHELEYLYPLLVSGGVLIIDDYGHWKGSRQAVDEYFGRKGNGILLNRIDYSGRIGIKR